MLFSLSIQRVDINGQAAGHVYQISKYEDFIGRPFDDLSEYMESTTAPRSNVIDIEII
jgi:hypothetical protein